VLEKDLSIPDNFKFVISKSFAVLSDLEWPGCNHGVAHSAGNNRCNGGSALHLQVQRTSPGKIVSYLEGTVDRQTVPAIRRKLLGSAKQTEVSHMVVDLSKVPAVDTAGVAMLVELLRVLAEKKGKLQLVGLNEQATKMIRLSRLDALFHVDNHSASGS
jgi:anti-anti-sigma factor